MRCTQPFDGEPLVLDRLRNVPLPDLARIRVRCASGSEQALVSLAGNAVDVWGDGFADACALARSQVARLRLA